MLNTEAALAKMGTDYVNAARRELNLTRTVTSKTTGKKYRKRITNTGKLANSFRAEVEDDKLNIYAASYARDVSEGTPRNASWAMLINWIKTKPYTFKTMSVNTQGEITSRGTSKGTPKQIDNFAKFLREKIRKVGSDRTGYLDDVLQSVANKYETDLEKAITKDIALNITSSLDKKPNVTARKL